MKIQHEGEHCLITVDLDDTLEAVAQAAGLILDVDSDDFLPFEWVTDRGDAYEAYMVFSDAGDGLSLIISKQSIDQRLIELCRLFVTPVPDA